MDAHTAPKAWFSYSHIPVNFRRFIASDRLSSIRTLAEKQWSKRSQIWRYNSRWASPGGLINFWPLHYHFSWFLIGGEVSAHLPTTSFGRMDLQAGWCTTACFSFSHAPLNFHRFLASRVLSRAVSACIFGGAVRLNNSWRASVGIFDTLAITLCLITVVFWHLIGRVSAHLKTTRCLDWAHFVGLTLYARHRLLARVKFGHAPLNPNPDPLTPHTPDLTHCRVLAFTSYTCICCIYTSTKSNLYELVIS